MKLNIIISEKNNLICINLLIIFVIIHFKCFTFARFKKLEFVMLKKCLRLFFFLLLFLSNEFNSQSCGGTFGSPVFLETFGSVNSSAQVTSPALVAPAYSSYIYRSVFPPDDGEYTIANTTEYLSWGWSKSLDHTNDVAGSNGNMLVVNASYTPGEFYRRRVSNLCSNQIYRFSAWILNIHRAGANFIKPNVTFQIRNTSGVVLGSVSTGDLSEEPKELWKNFYLDFKSDSNSSDVELILINNAPGGRGNDLAIDDISFSPCGPSTSIDADIAGFFTDGIYNNSKNVVLTAQLSSNTFLNANYIWQKSIDGGINWTDISAASSDPNLKVNAGTYQNNDRFRFIVGEAANINLSTCRVFSDAAVVKITGIPPAPDAKTFNFCQYSSENTIALAGSNFLWYSSALGGVASSSSPIINTSNVGTYVYWVSQKVNGFESARAAIFVNVLPSSTPPIVSEFKFCQNSPASALFATGNNLLWYTSASEGMGSPLPPVPDTSVAGNFSFWVSQTVNGCESARTEIKVEVLPEPHSDFLKNTSICNGEKVILDAGTGFASYEWQTVPPVFSQRLEVSAPGKYYVKLIDSKGCSAIQAVDVTLGISPVITQIKSGEDYLEIFAEGGNPPYLYSLNRVQWQTANVFSGLKAGVYEVYVKSQAHSCTAEAKTGVLFIPNAFTPNHDSFNDVWRVGNIEFFSKAKLKIFDKFGSEVFSADNIYSFAWNGFSRGRPLPTGTYWYVIEIEDQQSRSGWILLKNRN